MKIINFISIDSILLVRMNKVVGTKVCFATRGLKKYNNKIKFIIPKYVYSQNIEVPNPQIYKSKPSQL